MASIQMQYRAVRRTILAAFAAILMCGPMPVSGAEVTETQRSALNNLQHEVSECAMFYSISEEASDRNNSALAKNMSKHSRKLKDNFVEAAVTLAAAIGMVPDAVKARFRMSFNAMMDQMNDNFVNYSILLEKHAVSCAKLYDGFTNRYEGAMRQ